MTNWQPIETAPRDGTWFVICRVGEPDFYEVGCYEPTKYEMYEEVENGLFRKKYKDGYPWEGFSNMHRATHWAPLPEPPK